VPRSGSPGRRIFIAPATQLSPGSMPGFSLGLWKGHRCAIVIAVTANRLQINKLANVKAGEIEMMIVVIITMIVVAVLYFAWDEISAARADRKERERWGINH
jgi:hypothetical protein